MTATARTYGPAAAPSLHALRGIRFFEGEDGAGAVTPPVEPDAEPVTPPAEPGTEAPTPAGDESIDSLPDWAQRIIRDTRKQAGDYRAKAKLAADEAQRVKDQAAIALGLKQPDAPADPALTAAQKVAKDAATQLAILRAAPRVNANGDALLDSASFLANVAALDHTASTFHTDVEAAITAATAANPSLKQARAAGASAPDTPPGGGEKGRITEAQLQAASRNNPEQVSRWLAAGELNHLL